MRYYLELEPVIICDSDCDCVECEVATALRGKSK